MSNEMRRENEKNERCNKQCDIINKGKKIEKNNNCKKK